MCEYKVVNVNNENYVGVCDILTRRIDQKVKWGKIDSHHPVIWVGILSKQLGQVADSALDIEFSANNPSEFKMQLRHQLVDVAAVALAAIEQIDRQASISKPPVKVGDTTIVPTIGDKF